MFDELSIYSYSSAGFCYWFQYQNWSYGDHLPVYIVYDTKTNGSVDKNLLDDWVSKMCIKPQYPKKNILYKMTIFNSDYSQKLNSKLIHQ